MATADMAFEPGIVYGTGSGRDLMLDVLRPSDSGGDPRPAVVWVHGGGWMGGERAPSPNAPLVARGFVTASISYRFTQEAAFPAQIHDVKAAIRFLRANAGRWNIDPDRIGIWGASAGGHLAALAAVTAGVAAFEGEGGHPGVSSTVQAAVPLCPPTDFMLDWSRVSDYPPHPEVEVAGGQLLGGANLADPAVRAQATLASPLVHAWAGAAPTLVVHGARDDLVPVAQARSFVGRLRDVGAAVDYLELPDDDHSLPSVFGEEGAPPTGTMARIVEFFAKTLGPVAGHGTSG